MCSNAFYSNYFMNKKKKEEKKAYLVWLPISFELPEIMLSVR